MPAPFARVGSGKAHVHDPALIDVEGRPEQWSFRDFDDERSSVSELSVKPTCFGCVSRKPNAWFGFAPVLMVSLNMAIPDTVG
jgi:hypothetical protein